MYQLLKIHINEKDVNSWGNLEKLPYHARCEWIEGHLGQIINLLNKQNSLNENLWHGIGFICINNNLYKEAESVYDAMFNKTKSQRGNIAVPAYYRGISRFLQGRHREAYEDFKIARKYDLQRKNFQSPSITAIAYMEETIFPTKESVKKNQRKLAKFLSNERVIDFKVGPNKLKTIHKWNSASPLFSQGQSEGGGYLLTFRAASGKVKGIAIDPGYDFYDIFRDIGLSIADLDAIIVTHDHDDHTESIEGMLSLLAKYNDYNEQRKSKVLDIFGSAGTLLKFHGLLSATDPMGNKEINFKLLVPGSSVTEIGGEDLFDKHGFIIHVKPAFHSERWTNQESSIGLILETNIKLKNNEYLKIGITGDTRYVDGLGREYADAQVLLLNIGSLEKEEGKFLSQHLGMCGCINLLKEARLGKPLLAILTEFGEEFLGRRSVTSKIIEDWAQPLEKSKTNGMFRVIPADMNLEINLQDLTVRETETNVFFPYSDIEVDDKDPEILKYKFRG